MPYKKKNYRKPQYTVGGSVAHLAKRAMEGVSALRKIVNVETKRYDTSLAATSVDYNSITSGDALYNLAQGTTGITRNGDSIKLQSLRIRGEIRGTGSVTSAVRIILVKGIREADDAPVIGNILESSGAVSSYLQNRAYNFTQNYSVVYDKTVTVAFPGDFHGVKHFDIKYTPKNHHIKYVTAGGTTAENGGLYLFFISDRTATSLPTATYVSRMKFVDN